MDLGTGLLEIGRTFCRMGQALFDDERCVGRAETVLGVIDEDTRRTREFPEWVRTYLSGFNI